MHLVESHSMSSTAVKSTWLNDTSRGGHFLAISGSLQLRRDEERTMPRTTRVPTLHHAFLRLISNPCPSITISSVRVFRWIIDRAPFTLAPSITRSYMSEREDCCLEATIDKYIESCKFCSCTASVSQTNNAEELTAAITATSCNPVRHKSPSRKPAPCTVIRVPPEGFNCLGNASFIVASTCSKMSPLLVKSLPLWVISRL
mmetsp:Transcript_12516/g.52465  ORF Transcript_12516/g.52465 Transcript_12516/m.52465 type:complete len:202 (-) Transcript_12516:435-1040(-)